MLGVGSELETRSLVATWVKGCFTNLPELVYDRLGRSFVFLARGWADAGSLLASEGAQSMFSISLSNFVGILCEHLPRIIGS